MSTITVRNLPEEVVERIKQVARGHGRSMEQEVRVLLEHRYRPRAEVMDAIRARWEASTPLAPEAIEAASDPSAWS